MGIQWDHVEDEDTEPAVPAGLKDLSGALQAIVDFLKIDEDLIAVAAEASPALTEEPTSGLADWIATLPTTEKDKLLTMVADGEGAQVQALLRRRFRGETISPEASSEPARTAAQLWLAAGERKAAARKPKHGPAALSRNDWRPPRPLRTASVLISSPPGLRLPGRRSQTSSRRRNPANTTPRFLCCPTCLRWPPTRPPRLVHESLPGTADQARTQAKPPRPLRQGRSPPASVNDAASRF